jgi:hypothetical protein
MTALPGAVLPSPRLLFDAAITTRAGHDAYKGLAAYGAYDNSKVELGPESVLFVFPEELRGPARQLARAMFNGVSSYRGFARMFGVPVVLAETVQALPIDTPLTDHAAAAVAYRAAIERWGATGSARLAVVVVPHSDRWEIERPYYEAKAALAALGIPSQMVTAEVLADQRQFSWSVANIALAAFAKLGGIPWTVEAPPEDDDLVLGVGRREVRSEGERRRVFGYAVALVSNGVYRHTWSSAPTADLDEYGERLADIVQSALQDDVDQPPRRVVVHLASRAGRAEIEAIEAAVAAARMSVPVALLRLDDTTRWDIADETTDTYAAPKGTAVSLGPRRALLQSSGLTAVGAPEGPILVEMDRRSTVDASAMDDLVAQAFRLAHANWRGFNARSKPATLVYGEQLADLVGYMAHVEGWSERLPTTLARRPWFL